METENDKDGRVDRETKTQRDRHRQRQKPRQKMTEIRQVGRHRLRETDIDKHRGTEKGRDRD